ncbi:non-heme iron oxygenase ferredoxin subunit [Botrimarina sp.]|uniref:Rieske (2Fe-2S) protein n=1 Tax=Botrimarina sp. TaxID=2795802 RepID=UPI0032F02CD7
MSGFVAVGQAADFADPSSTLVEVDDGPIVLIHAAGKFYALDDVCTHDGGPLSDGEVFPEDPKPSIACPRHGAKFALATGAALTMPATKPTRAHETKVEDGQVFVRLCD